EQFKDFKSVGIGTGPFMVKEFKTDQFTLLERNPDWKEMGEDGKPLPYIDNLQVFLGSDYAAEVAAMRTGAVDLNGVQGFRKLDADLLKQSNPKLIGYNDTVAAVWGLHVNHGRPPFGDPRVRKALAFALNGDDIIDNHRGGAIRSGFLPAALRDYAWPSEKVREKFKPDLEQARKLLADAGYSATKPLEFALKSGPNEQQSDVELLQKQLEAAGIKARISIEQVSSSVVVSRGDYDVAYAAITPSSYFPDRWFGGAIRTKGSQNYINLSDPKLDELSLAQAREMDVAKRKQIIDQIQDQMFDQMAYVPIMNRLYFRFYSCRTRGMKPTHQSLDLRGVDRAWLDQSAC
ncbi:MAG: ABC transporter substrate-binding protein, partial [Chloroflexota bacterium]